MRGLLYSILLGLKLPKLKAYLNRYEVRTFISSLASLVKYKNKQTKLKNKKTNN